MIPPQKIKIFKDGRGSPRSFSLKEFKNFILFPLTVSGAIVIGLFVLKHNKGLNLCDEGFLWLGSQMVLKGSVPVLDFHSYNPGRYYWSAFWFRFLDSGLVSLRFSEALFQWIGVLGGMLAARRITSSRFELAVFAFILALWMYPDYKFIDCAIPCIAVYAGVRLLETPDLLESWIVGVVAGLAFFFGQQHGLYLVLAFSALILFSFLKNGFSLSRLLAYVFGLFCGFLPFLGMLLWVHGFAESYWNEMIMFWIRFGQTNISLPIPWIWKKDLFIWSYGNGMPNFVLGFLTVLMPPAYLYWVAKSWKQLKTPSFSPLLMSSAVIGACYLQYYFARADYEHLAAIMAPFLIGLFGQMGNHHRTRLLWLFLALIVTCTSVAVKSGLMDCWNSKTHWPLKVLVGKDTIHLSPREGILIEAAKAVAARLKPGETFLAYPHLTTLYAVCNLKSPTWEIYDVIPKSLEEQDRLIRETESAHVSWALIDTEPVDGRNDLRFQNTNALFCRYLLKNFSIVRVPFLPPDFFLLKRSNKINSLH